MTTLTTSKDPLEQLLHVPSFEWRSGQSILSILALPNSFTICWQFKGSAKSHAHVGKTKLSADLVNILLSVFTRMKRLRFNFELVWHTSHIISEIVWSLTCYDLIDNKCSVFLIGYSSLISSSSSSSISVGLCSIEVS